MKSVHKLSCVEDSTICVQTIPLPLPIPFNRLINSSNQPQNNYPVRMHAMPAIAHLKLECVSIQIDKRLHPIDKTTFEAFNDILAHQ